MKREPVEEKEKEKEKEKQLAAEAAAELVESGMIVGLGTGSTVAHLIPALSARRLSIRCVCTSPQTERAAKQMGLRVEAADFRRLDVAIDGADQIGPDGWLVKGGGGAHTREKLVAVSADRFIVIADSSKRVPELHPPVPLELLVFGIESTLARLGHVRLRESARSPDGGVIADFSGEVGTPERLAARLEATPGVIGHGLFPPQMVATIFVARGNSVERIDLRPE